MRVVSWTALIVGVLLTATLVPAQTLSGSLVVVVRDEQGGPVLAIADLRAGKVVARVSTGADPHLVAMSDDGTLAFVANTNGHQRTLPRGDSISVIDVAARKEIRRVEVGEGTRPHDIHAAGDSVYFTASSYRALGRYDLKSHKVEYFGLGYDPHAFVISNDQNTIFVANPESNNVSVLQNVRGGAVISYPPRPTDWKVSVIPVGDRPLSIDMSPDGREVWTANSEEGGGVTVIDVATKVARPVHLETNHINRLRFTPDGTQVLILDRRAGELVALEASTRKVLRRVKLPGDTPGETTSLGDVLVQPDGSRAYVAVNSRAIGGSHYIAVIDMKTLSVTSRIQTTAACVSGPDKIGVCGNGLGWAPFGTS